MPSANQPNQPFLNIFVMCLCLYTWLLKMPHSPSRLPLFHFLSIYFCFRLVQSALHKLHSQEAHLLLHAPDLFSHHADGDAVLGVFLDWQKGRTCSRLTGYRHHMSLWQRCWKQGWLGDFYLLIYLFVCVCKARISIYLIKIGTMFVDIFLFQSVSHRYFSK